MFAMLPPEEPNLEEYTDYSTVADIDKFFSRYGSTKKPRKHCKRFFARRL